MDGIASVGGVGAGLSQAKFRVEYQVRVLKEQQDVVSDLGHAALKLIRTAITANGSMGRDLDVRA